MYKVGTFFDMTVPKGARCFLEIVTLKVLLFKNISVTRDKNEILIYAVEH